MAEVLILLALKKICFALGNEISNQASSQFKKFITQLTELQGSMSRIRRELRLMHEFLCQMDVCNRNNQTYEVWVQEVRMLVHGIQDIVDEYLYLVGRKHDTGWGTYLKKGFNQPNVLLSLNRVATLVKEAEVNLVHLFLAKDRWVSMASGGSSSDNSSNIVERSQHMESMSRPISDLYHVRNVLLLSFKDLPTYLKSCFLYCGLFPEDYLLKRKRLIPLWIAEGFIEKKGGSTLEEVAEGYLNELVHRNMLELIERNSFGRIKSLRMHDIVRDLAVDLCQRECFGVAYQEDEYGGESLEEKDGRRLVIHKLKSDIQRLISGIHHLRSLITLYSGIPSSTLLSSVSTNSRYISVLELSGLPIKTVPDAIGDLFNLRHLGLRDSKVTLLPKSIEKLSNLLTLDLCRSNIQELPRGIVKLKKLRHIFAEKVSDRSERDFRCRSGVCTPKGLGNLIDLQTLQALEAQDEFVGELWDLKQLRSIRIWNVKSDFCERLCESLVQMQFLSNLDLTASDENEVLQLKHLDPLPPNLQKLGLRGRLAEGMFGESPLFQTNGHNLYSLHLHWSQLRQDPLPCLSRLSSLTDLRLARAYNGEQLVFLAKWFPTLKKLYLRDMPNLKRLEIQQGAMASLEELSLINLSSMTEVPPGIEFLMPLKYLSFDEITPEFLMLLHECRRIGGMRWWWSLRDGPLLENLLQGDGHMEEGRPL